MRKVSIVHPVEEITPIVATALRKRVQDLTIVILDRPRHQKLVEAVRSTGATLRMISDGDITAAIAPSIADSGVDLYVGIGGSPEAALAAAAPSRFGGGIQGLMLAPGNAAEQHGLK